MIQSCLNLNGNCNYTKNLYIMKIDIYIKIDIQSRNEILPVYLTAFFRVSFKSLSVKPDERAPNVCVAIVTLA